MDKFLEFLSSVSSQIWSTVLFFVILFSVRHLAVRWIRNSEMVPEIKRRWFAQIRNLTYAITILSVFIIWGQELRNVALSMVALTAAFVLATKELILCLSGSFLRSSGNSFRIGDLIGIGSGAAVIRGEVVDHTLLTTTLYEIGPGETTHQRTGRRIVLPNSLLLTMPVTNDTFSHDYVLHTFSLVLKIHSDWKKVESVLLEAAKQECAEYIEDARKRMEKVGKRQAVDTFSVDPKITLSFPTEGQLLMLMRITVPAGHRSRIEQSILRKLLDANVLKEEEKPK